MRAFLRFVYILVLCAAMAAGYSSHDTLQKKGWFPPTPVPGWCCLGNACVARGSSDDCRAAKGKYFDIHKDRCQAICLASSR